ncbi:cytochrome P450 [Aspergillus multicolor]|uniref:cytochrome P450 n=1 Tax=Aspergillus multicolor TaxID=41759 RepID=UPI003CCD7B67
MATTVFLTAALALATWLVLRLFTQNRKLDMPYLKFEDGNNSMERYARESGSIMTRGYELYLKKGLPFAMFNCLEPSQPIAILPIKYLAEVRGAAASKLSFPAFMNRSTVADHIGAPPVTDRVTRVAKLDLNKALNDLIIPIQHTCTMVLDFILPHGKQDSEWTPVPAQVLFWAPISRVMTLVLVGPELCTNEEWNNLLAAYLHHGHATAKHVRETYRPWMRWTAKYLDKDVKAMAEFRKKGTALLKPVIEARVKATGQSGGQKGPFKDATQWLVDSYLADGHGKGVDAEQVMQDMSFLMAASLHGILMNGVSILFDLIERPEALEAIREEVGKVQSETVSKQGGFWNRQTLGSLLVLDSFMKESQRLHTFQHYTMQRIALQDVTFSDGLRIPAGTWLQMPSRMHGRDSDVVPGGHGEEFDALRWKQLRQQGDATKFHFASVQDDMLPWGSGAHACPGRFLVQDVLKLIFIHLITKYDIKFAESESRPADLEDHTGTMPNIMSNVLFKERSV